MTTTWKPDPEDSTFELGWEGDTPTGERRQAPVRKQGMSKKAKVILALGLAAAFALIAVAGVGVGIALSMKAVEQGATESTLRELAVEKVGYDPQRPGWEEVGKQMCSVAEGKSMEEFSKFVKPIMQENGLNQEETIWLPLIALIDYCPDEAMRLSSENLD